MPTEPKVLLAFLPKVVMAVMRITIISASMTACSTALPHCQSNRKEDRPSPGSCPHFARFLD
jgi:hypothetical protein